MVLLVVVLVDLKMIGQFLLHILLWNAIPDHDG
jgi:hypothetical protein